MTATWFESVAEAERRAEKRLPRSVFSALRAGAEQGLTLSDNVMAFGELGLAPHVAGLPFERDLSTSVMGQSVALPVLCSPTGAQAVHPDGELAVARASAARGTTLGLSSFASKPMEEVVAANPGTLFQIYWAGSREQVAQRVERARRTGAAGLIVTLDWTFTHSRDWGSPSIPDSIDLRTMARFAPEVLRKPRWLASWARTGSLPDLGVPNMSEPDGTTPTFFQAYGQWMGTPPPSWDDLAWLREQWAGPFMIKGIMRVDDAREAVRAGFSCLSVSNHGGNNLDSTPAAIRALPAIVDEVGEQIEVVMDGGVRRGSDVVKALALGARAVMIGRPYLWALGAHGQAGVENVLDVLRNGIDSTLLGLGRSSVKDLCREDVVIPQGFVRRLGA
jgi:heme/flavin dehydrogenase (mycofactocin system)